MSIVYCVIAGLTRNLLGLTKDKEIAGQARNDEVHQSCRKDALFYYHLRVYFNYKTAKT